MVKNIEGVINVFTMNNNKTINFAAFELKKYIEIMTGNLITTNIQEKTKYDILEDGIYLGLYDEFNLAEKDIEDMEMDDSVHINLKNLNGIIAGSNFRSVLFGVYKYLEKIGCRWVRHGIDGEYIPKKSDLSFEEIKFTTTASYRHRGICIEGSVSIENMLDNIDWAAKMGFNSYFIQFMKPFTFFDRWYSHSNNKYKKTQTITLEDVKNFMQTMAVEIKKRGMIYQAVGHGWTCEPFGIEGLGWDSKEYMLTPQQQIAFAEVNGKREIWEGIPLNTNMCMSNEKVRKTVVDYCVKYIKNSNQIDIIHFWMADGINNHCECDECCKSIPSDFYIKLLNELDVELIKNGLTTKVVFLLYVDLLWAPKSERLNNPQRFILMFAPITRTYSEPYNIEPFQGALPEYNRNSLAFPKNVAENIAYLREWQKSFPTDSFAFEYYYMWDHYNDFGYFEVAKTIYEDIKRLKALDLNGMISCQTQRSFMPIGLGMYIMAKTLWNDKICFNETADEYFQSAFGLLGVRCKNYMISLSELCVPSYIRGEHDWADPAITEKFSKAQNVIMDMKNIIDENIAVYQRNECLSKSWMYVQFHAELIFRLLEAFKAKSKGECDLALKLWEEVADYAQVNEDKVQSVFDVNIFINTMTKKFEG